MHSCLLGRPSTEWCMRLCLYVRVVLRNGLGPSVWTGGSCGSADGLSYLSPRSRRLGDFVEQTRTCLACSNSTLWPSAGSCHRCARASLEVDYVSSQRAKGPIVGGGG